MVALSPDARGARPAERCLSPAEQRALAEKENVAPFRCHKADRAAPAPPREGIRVAGALLPSAVGVDFLSPFWKERQGPAEAIGKPAGAAAPGARSLAHALQRVGGVARGGREQAAAGPLGGSIWVGPSYRAVEKNASSPHTDQREQPA